MTARLGRLPAILVLGVALALGGCAKGSGKADDPAGARGGKKAALVKVARVVSQTVPLEEHTIGTVQPLGSVAVRAQVGGVIQKVCFRQGQMVQAGDALFELDSRPLQATLQQVEAVAARDTAQLHLAERQFERYTKLYRQGGVSEDQYDQLRATLGAQKSTLAADQANVQNARLQLGFTTLRSPITGLTGSFQVTQGNLVRVGDAAPLVTINQISPIQVVFTMPEHLLSEIQRYRGQHALQLTASSAGAFTQTGTLTFVDNAVDATTGTISLRGTFDNAEHKLWPGASVEVRMKLADQANALLIPSSAVQDSQQGPFVYVVGADKTVEARPVTPARTYQDSVVIQKGLALGEEVVTDGQLGLVPGAKVRTGSGRPGSSDASGSEAAATGAGGPDSASPGARGSGGHRKRGHRPSDSASASGAPDEGKP